eukprot:292742-Pelagomonas_calceolata.AAC.1
MLSISSHSGHLPSVEDLLSLMACFCVQTVTVQYLTTFICCLRVILGVDKKELLISLLTGWVVSFYIGSSDCGSGLYGMVEPPPASVMIARDISRDKLVLFVHVQFKFVGQVVGWESVGAVQAIILPV